MDDTISRQAAIDALNKMKIYRPLDSDRYVISDCLNKIVNLPSAQPDDEETNYWHEKANSYEQTLAKLTQNIAEQPEIIHCKDCKHHIDGRCLVANHHTVDHECCAEVFGAERKEDALN